MHSKIALIQLLLSEFLNCGIPSSCRKIYTAVSKDLADAKII